MDSLAQFLLEHPAAPLVLWSVVMVVSLIAGFVVALGQCVAHAFRHFTHQPEREAQLLAQVEADWRESFTGSIDEFIARDAA